MDVEQLRQQIDAANQAYWLKHEPVISDAEYDRLVEQLRILDPEDVRLHYVGGAVGTVVHDPPMLSLAKCYTHQELVEWCESVSRTEQELFLVQPKYDGIAGKLVSHQGGLQLSTRGDGHRGEDITGKLCGIKLSTRDEALMNAWDRPSRQDLTAYGELVLTNADFERYCLSGKYLKQNGEKYNTQRNAVAGMVSLKASPCQDGDRPLTLVDYHFYEQQLTLAQLKDAANWEQVQVEVEELGYPVDGIVVKLADPQLAQQLGATAHHPRSALAFKFANDTARTRIESIEWRAGMSRITPLAHVAPVKLGGTVIRRATLFNVAYVRKHGFEVGDTVRLERAGDVIPHICVNGHVRSEGHRLRIHRRCPACGGPVQEVGKELICAAGDGGVGRRLARLGKAVKELELDGIGQALLQQLIAQGVTQVHELLALTPEQLEACGCGPKVAAKLVAVAREACQRITPAQLLSAFAIPGISQPTAAKLLVVCRLQELVAATPAQLQDWYQGFGEAGHQLVAWLSVDDNLLELTKCMMLCTNLDALPSTCEPAVCFSGRMSLPRDAMSALAQAHGYRTVNTVTRGLDMLVVPDQPAATPSDKLVKAQRYGVQILTETQFRQQLATE